MRRFRLRIRRPQHQTNAPKTKKATSIELNNYKYDDDYSKNKPQPKRVEHAMKRFRPLFICLTLLTTLGFSLTFLNIPISGVNEEETITVHKPNDDDNFELYHHEILPDLSYLKNRTNEGGHRIPRHVVIIDTRYKTIHDIPHPFQQNVQHTVKSYIESWDDVDLSSFKKPTPHDNINIDENGNGEQNHNGFVDYFTYVHRLMDSKYVWYLNEDECLRVVRLSEPKLLRHYLAEEKGRYRANICRIAALYQRGGYYFDSDMEVVKPFIIEPHITFISPFEKFRPSKDDPLKGIFNSFIAVAPKHPLLRENLNVFLTYYKRKQDPKDDKVDWEFRMHGTCSLFKALKIYTNAKQETLVDIRNGKVPYNHSNANHNFQEDRDEWPLQLSLSEIRLTKSKYPDLPRQRNGKGCCCNFVVHDTQKKEIYFYSRVVGTDNCNYRYKIPRRLVFADTQYDSIENMPSKVQQNVNQTIRAYTNHWDTQNKLENITLDNNSKPIAKVDYLDDAQCQRGIQKVEPRLLVFYQSEQRAENKANICQIVTLYDQGGYYFNTDIQVVDALSINPNVTFVAPLEANSTWNNVKGLMNSFVAVMPKHPLLRINLDVLVQYYQSNVDPKKRNYKGREFPLLGSDSLIESFTEFQNANVLKKSGIKSMHWPIDLSLAETDTSNVAFRDFPHRAGKGCCCNDIIHNVTENHVYFYSRMVGSEPWCVGI